MKKITIIIAIAAIVCSACKRIDENDDANNTTTSESELNNTRTDVSEIEGDTMSVEIATGMDTTTVDNAEVGAAGKSGDKK